MFEISKWLNERYALSPFEKSCDTSFKEDHISLFPGVAYGGPFVIYSSRGQGKMTCVILFYMSKETRIISAILKNYAFNASLR